ncbi:FAD-dependent oxidoreductase [Kitasatospora sp. GP82]|uniref:flavin monoamine oxidase family protein n=1 Tax=Kitasatospora sp. GP82 TaxID=3035089 RepID=UPI0024764644|nr:FAD-dependent oxidoreductase [Kitasatospora sp. GP82]MDH6129900.1 monoamine oxidase [Kitasatospora sp. GP82]
MTGISAAAQALREAMAGNAGPEATGWTGSFDLPPAPREGASVLVLGAGIAGLTAAYELSSLGYRCTVLEAQKRVGGRNRTARNGDRLYEIGPTGEPVETHRCAFDDDLYLNLGPGRIPYHHRRVLKYCRDFEVDLEPYIMETTANLVRLSNGRSTRWRNRRVANDTRGHLAALLAETLVEKDAFTGQLLDLLRVFGPLDENGDYHGSTRSGYSEDLDVHDFPKPAPPLGFQELVESEFWKQHFYQPADYLWQATMFQPVGGMDKIVDAFAEEIEEKFGEIIKLNAQVTAITLPEKGGVAVDYTLDGKGCSEVADYCVSSIPLPVLLDIDLLNFSREFNEAIRTVGFANTCKVGWQANERFWEYYPDMIYGGISWTDHNITQMWYPSNDYFSEKGTLTGAYNFDDEAVKLGNLKPKERLKDARKGAIGLHHQFKDEDIVPSAKGVSIAWHKVPHQLGGWAAWDPRNAHHMVAYKQLLQPEGGDRFYVMGDQASPLPGWQEGAMMSAHYVIGQMLGIVPLAAPEVVQVPDSVALTQGSS